MNLFSQTDVHNSTIVTAAQRVPSTEDLFCHSVVIPRTDRSQLTMCEIPIANLLQREQCKIISLSNISLF